MHTNKTNGKKYIGITSQKPKERWRNGLGYKEKHSYFWNAINKYTWDGFTHEIVADNLTEREAKRKEVELIAFYKTNCHRYKNPTYGYNMTDGGEGTTGWIPSEQTKKNISDALKGKFVGANNPNFGNHKLAGENNPNYGKKHTEEIRQKISQAKKGKYKGSENPNYDNHKLAGVNHPLCTPVYCIEMNEIFWGIIHVQNKYGFDKSSVRRAVINDGMHAGKHPVNGSPLSWKYVYDKIQKDGTIIQGAITLGYITQQQADEYLNNLKQKEIDIL